MTAYVLPPITAVSTPAGALSMSNLLPLASGWPSRMLETCLGLAGFVISTITNAPWPSSRVWPYGSSAVIMAYVRLPTTKVSMYRTPTSRSNCELSECRRAAVGSGFAGSVTSIIWTPPLYPLVRVPLPSHVSSYS